jgi:hypothetical protein
MKAKLFVAVLVAVLALGVVSVQAEEVVHPTVHIAFFQPTVSSGFGKEMLLGSVDVSLLRIGRFTALGGGIGLSSADPNGGFTLIGNVANFRLVRYAGPQGWDDDHVDLHIGIRYIYDTHTKFGGLTPGFSVSF